MKLLIVMMMIVFLSAVVLFFTSNNARNSYYSHNDICEEYLKIQDESWTRDGDFWYQKECDYDNSFSEVNYLSDVNKSLYKNFNVAVVTIFGFLAVMFCSYLGRWLIMGRWGSK